jgi:hypothetical protein
VLSFILQVNMYENVNNNTNIVNISNKKKNVSKFQIILLRKYETVDDESLKTPPTVTNQKMFTGNAEVNCYL